MINEASRMTVKCVAIVNDMKLNLDLQMRLRNNLSW